MRSIYFLGPIFLLLMISCGEEANKSSSTKDSGKGLVFTESESSGVDFVNEIKESARMNHFLWDAMYNGGGVGLGDLNNDGFPDIYLVSTFGKDKIYINKGDMTFEDITSKSGINKTKSISSGVTFVDINNDGFLDIYVSMFGYTQTPTERVNELYINNGDLTFTESASVYGVDNSGFTIQSTFFDYDKDGLLDLFVMNQPSGAREIKERYFKGGLPESNFIDDDTSDCLYKNMGNNKFKNVSVKAGIRNFAYGLGLIATDIDNDGWTDIFVANDYDKQDYLYINQKDGTFKDMGKASFDHNSNFSMGTDIEDLNNDGFLDIAVLDMAGADHVRSKTNMPSMRPEAFWKQVEDGKHYQYMHNTLQLNHGNGQFSDEAYMAGIAKTDWSWGLLINDYNNDAFEDIYITNGIKLDVRNSDFIQATIDKIAKDGIQLENLMEIVDMVPSVPMSNYLYLNDGQLHFNDKASEAGVGKPGFSNGSAFADLDLDGDLDLVVNNVNAKASVYEGNGSKLGNCVRVKLMNSRKNKPVHNSRVTVYADGLVKVKELLNARGYKSISEPTLHFGLGEITKVDSVVITWADNNQSVLTNIKVNEVNVIDQSKTKKIRKYKKEELKQEYFAESSKNKNIAKHKENDFNAFNTQLLLPYQPSELGPFLAVGDLNGDGLEDMVVGAAFGSSTEILLQNSSGEFSKSSLSNSKNYEDMGIELFDADQDGDLDLFISSGGYEYDKQSNKLEDRLYINNGKATFTSKNIKTPRINSGKSIAFDYDNDNDLDIMVFGRVESGKYPMAPDSYLLENKGSNSFEDVTESKAPFLQKLGMITDAVHNDDNGVHSIAVVGEWMSPKIITAKDGSINIETIGTDINGLWFGINSADLDGDGDLDYVLGNIGKNSKFKASKKKPFKVYADDFDKNGTSDIVLASYYGDKVVPVRGRECSSEQLPMIQEKFKTYESFAVAGLEEIYDLDSASLLQAQTLESGILWNDQGSWVFESLPMMAQISPINDIEIVDVNNDGKSDLVVAGNLYAMEVETTRLDAGKGLVMLQGDNRSFETIHSSKSGLFAKGDAKDMGIIDIAGKQTLVISMNDDYLQFFDFKNN